MSMQATELGQRLDSLVVSPWHRRVFWLIAGGLFFDAFDIYIGAGVVADLVDKGFTERENIAYFLSATSLGLLVGALIGGYTGDRFGRRLMYQFNLLLFGGASLLAAAAPNYEILVALRFIMGVGLGAETVLAYATFAEFIPARVRGRWIGFMGLLANGSLFVASIISYLVIPLLTWRAMFVIVAVPTLILWRLRKVLPESPRWLLAHGEPDTANQVVEMFEEESARATRTGTARSEEGAPEVAVAASTESELRQQGRLSELFSRPLLSRTLLGMLFLIAINYGVYGFVTFVPSEFVSAGFSVAASLGMTILISAGAVAGSAFALWRADNYSSQPFIAIIALLVSISGVFYAFSGSEIRLIIAGFLLLSFLYCFVVLTQSLYVPMLFPSNLRMRGAGVTSAAGRLTSVIAPFIVSALIPLWGFSGAVYTIAAVFLVTAILVVIFGADVHRKNLEQIADEALAQSRRRDEQQERAGTA